MKLDQLKAEQSSVLTIMETRILSADAISRGWKKYDELGAEIAAEEQRISELTPEQQATIDKTWAALDPTGKRRRTTK